MVSHKTRDPYMGSPKSRLRVRVSREFEREGEAIDAVREKPRGREKTRGREKKEQPRGRKREPPPRLVAAPAVHGAGERTKTLAMVALVRSR